MSTAVVLSDLFGRAYNDLDGSLKSRVMDFVVKLQRDPTSPGRPCSRGRWPRGGCGCIPCSAGSRHTTGGTARTA